MAEAKNAVEGKQKKKNNILWIVLIIILLVVAGIAIWKMMGIQSEYDQLAQEKEKQRMVLTTELDSMVKEHNAIKVEYGELADSLAVKDSVIQANAKEIKQLLNTKWEYYKVKKKLDRLRNITQGYLHQMDSLYRENAELKAENSEMKQTIERVEKKSRKLEKQQKEIEEKIEQVAMLPAYDIINETMRIKGSGTERETDKARRVEKIKVCFNLQPNPLVENGNKNVYVRISRPDGSVLFKDKSDEYSFEYQGQKLQWSMKKTFKYSGQEEKMCLEWTKLFSDDKFEPGNYSVDIYVDGQKSGSSVFFLK